LDCKRSFQRIEDKLTQPMLEIKKAYFHFYNQYVINIVGCGGIGSWFIPGFLKIMMPILSAQNGMEIHLWDPDIVEMRNVERQNFIVSDVGKAKAEVLALRYGNAYDISDFIIYHVKKYKCHQDDFVIAFVDDPQTRVQISRMINWSGLYLDVGNEKKAGQAYLQVERDRQGRRSPKLIDVFPNLLTAKKDKSCADDAQNLYINHIGADVALSIAKEIIIEKSIGGILTFFGTNRVQRTLDIDQVKNLIVSNQLRNSDEIIQP